MVPSDGLPESPAPATTVLRAPGRPVFADGEVDDALRRVERSAGMRHSTQLRRLLRHLVLSAQVGAEHALREIVVGVEALGRDPARFDPRQDPIVRTEARRLRAKLADYYAGEGRDDPIVIEVPKGGYLPVLRKVLAADALDSANVAVLPFANFTGDAAREASCDALTDEVIDALARIPSLRVIARTSSFRYKNTRADARTIAASLTAGLLLEGSVQQAGERVRVIAQLVLGRDGSHVWSQAFEGPAGALTAIESALADEIVRAMERAGALSPVVAERLPPLPRTTQDAQARDSYERALAILRSLDTSRYTRASELLDDALRRDPRFARAHHLQALVLANRVAMCTQPAQEAMPKALAHLAQALELEPAFAQARSLAAWITAVWERDWPRALADMQRALRDGPGHFPVRNAAGNLLALLGRFDDAEAELAIARELDPLHLTARYNAAIVALYARRFDLVLERCNAILDIEPAHAAHAMRVGALVFTGRRDEALAAARQRPVGMGAAVLDIVPLAIAMAAHGDMAGGLAILRDNERALAAADVVNWAQAHVCAAAEDREATFAALERACGARESNTEAAAVDPYFTFLHDDARWPGFVARHRLPQVH